AIAPCPATVTYSAWQPKPNPREATTLSPGRKWVTSLPTASTWPAISKPKMGCFGLVKPSLTRIGRLSPRGTRSALTRVSPELTVVATALTRTSPSAGTGFGTSRICTTSGGPYRSQTAAFIADPAAASQHGTAARCTAIGPAPGMDTAGFGSEVTGIVVFVAGWGTSVRRSRHCP